MIKTCPDPVDVQDLQFKLHCRLKVFENTSCEPFKQPHNLVTSASRYGLVFIGTNTGSLQVVQLKCVEDYTPKDKDISDYPRRNVNLPSTPKHLSVNCDSSILAVVIEPNNIPSVLFYDVLSFVKQNIVLFKHYDLSKVPVQVVDLSWNPSLPQIFTVCKSDGSLNVLDIGGASVVANELPAASGACCFCWSPKGKQIAVGSKDGKITQYKPDLKAVKAINAPPLQGVHLLCSLQWVSNYQFIGVYHSINPDPQISVIVVDAPKTGEPSFTNYDDICYSNGNNRGIQFYMNLQPQWNLLMVASSNSTELGILSNNGELWTQWILSDTARAELPLSVDHQDTLPVGLSVDISSTKNLPWGEGTIPPAPILLILSHQGVLCLFDVINLKQGIPSICTPPDSLADTSGLSLYIKPTVTSAVTIQKPVPASVQTTETPKTAFSCVPASNPNNAPQIPTSNLFGAKQPSTQASGFFTVQEPSIQKTPLFGLQDPKSQKGGLFGTADPSVQKPGLFTPVDIQKPGLFGSPQTLNLFGGEATIAPIKPQQSTVQKPEQISSTTTTTPMGVASKYTAIFSSIQAPVATVPNTVPTVAVTVLPQTGPNRVITDVKPNVAEQPIPKKHEPQTTVSDKTDSETIIDANAKAEMEAHLARMIKDECYHLQIELNVLLDAGHKVKLNLGADAEKHEIINNIDSLDEFVTELTEIGQSQSAEIHYLKQNLIQSWAWFEEARSRYNCSKDETMKILLRAQPLDSASEKILKDMCKHMCYLDSQLSQASRALDEQWDKFQDYAKKSHRTQMPTMEAIFQAMVRQNAILQKQIYIMKDITTRMKMKYRTSTTPSLLMAIENLDLEDDFKKLNIQPQDITQLQYEKILTRRKELSLEKSSKIKNFLKKRDVLQVTVIKPQLSNSLLQQTPLGKSKQRISILGAQMSPVPKPIPRNLEFIQSTPKKDIFTPPNTPATGGNQHPGFSFNTNPNIGFHPVSKSISQIGINQPSQQMSAFVPTTQASNFIGLKVGLTGKSNLAPVSKSTSQPTIVSITTWGGDLPTTVSVSFVTTATKASTQPTFTFGSNLFSSNKTTLNTMFSSAKPQTTTAPTIKSTQPSSFFESSSLPNLGQVASTSSILSFGSSTPVSSGKSSAFSAVSSGDSLQDLSKSTSSTSFFGSSVATSIQTSSSSVTAAAVPVVTEASSSQPLTIKPIFSAFTSPNNTVVQPTFGLIPTSSTSAEEKSMSKISFGNTTVTKVQTTSTVAPTPSVTKIFSSTTPISTTTKSFFGAFTTTTTAVSTAVSISDAKTRIINSTSTPASTGTAPLFSSSSAAVTTSAPLFGGSFFGTATVSENTGSSTTTSTGESAVFGIGSPFSTKTFGTPLFTKPSTPITDTEVTSTVVSSTVTSTTISPASGIAGSNPSIPSTTASAVLAATVSSTVSAPSTTIFAPATTSIAPIFGITTVASSSTPAFGTSTVISSSTPVFGTSTAISSSAPVLGTSTAISSSTPVFGTSTVISPTPTFGTSTAISSSASVSVSSTATSSLPPAFGTSTIVSSSTPAFGTSTAASSTAPAFGMGTAASPSAPAFGLNITSTVGSSITNAAVTASPIFGSGTSATTTSVFSPAASDGSSTGPSIFAAAGVSTTSSSSPIFANAAQGLFTSKPASTTSNIFGGGATSGGSIFGGAQTVAATQPIFGGSPTTPTTNVFGSPTSSSQPIFGGAPTTSSGSIFGTASTTVPSVFGNATTTTTQSVFGAVTSAPAFASGAAFGQIPASSFGTPVFGSPNVFGGTQPATSSTFGQPSTFVGSSQSIFGGNIATSTNVFGGTPTTSSGFGSSPAFGTPTSNSASPFGNADNNFGATSSQASSFSFANAGNNPNAGSSFAFGSLNVGTSSGAPTSSANIFGTNSSFGSQSSSNPFARSATTATSGGSIFGNPSSTSNSIFGSSNTGPTFGSSGTTFGSTTFGSSSTFPQSGGFGSPQPGGPFSGGGNAFGSSQPGPFSGGGSSTVAQGGFGSPVAFQKPAFGASPAFGSTPAFGSPPSFGGAPTFGSPQAFGSPGKVFGSGPTGGSFGGGAVQSPTFGNLANQNTVGFGNLAQQQQQPSNNSNNSFSGGSSFSSWR